MGPDLTRPDRNVVPDNGLNKSGVPNHKINASLTERDAQEHCKHSMLQIGTRPPPTPNPVVLLIPAVSSTDKTSAVFSSVGGSGAGRA